MDQTKRIFYILLNISILAILIFGSLKIKNFLSDDGSLALEKNEQKKIDKTASSQIEKDDIIKAKNEIVEKQPEISGPVQKKYSWKYAGKDYSISKELYISIYEFYKSQPKTYTYFNELPKDWDEEYYGMFLTKNEKYNFVKEFLDEIVSQGQKNKLSEDQIVELIMSFVQTIPYDDQKASNILSGTGNETMNYPYETLFENSGVCSDKSFLAISLLREFGYGTAIFIYENENHMAIGIQCPIEHSNYQSGYCYGESTVVGNKIGIVAELKAYAGKAVGEEKISYFGENVTEVSQTTKLGEVKIFQKTLGKEYKGIIQTVKINKEIAFLKSEISSLAAKLKAEKIEINEMSEKLSSQRKKLDQYVRDGYVDKYNDKAKDYNKILDKYKDAVDDYNKDVKRYNEKVTRYNYLIKS